MQREKPKVKVNWIGDDRNYLISHVTVRKNSSTLSSVQFTPKNGDWVQVGQELGKIICSDGYELPIKSSLTGSIENVNTNYNFILPSFPLCKIHLCGHDDLIQTDLQHMHICSKCNEQVWVYRDKTAGVIEATKFSEFSSNKRVESRDIEYDIKFGKLMINQIIQPNLLLFEAEQSSNNSDSESEDEEVIKIEFRLNQSIYIKDINYNYNQDRSWILKYEKVICSHQVIDKTNTCTFCQQHLPDHSNQTYVGLAQKENKLQIGKEYAEYSKKMVHQELHQNQKLILVLDLDNTLLHAIPAMKNATFDNSEGNQKDSFLEFHNTYNKYAIKFRPYMKEFLQSVLPHYEIYIYTMAVFDYAKSICDYLKETYKDILVDYPKIFGYDRIISRDQSDKSEKNLQQILPNSEKIMLILDDRDDVWTNSKLNLVTTLPYIYWWDGKESYNEQAQYAVKKILDNRNEHLHKNSRRTQKPKPQTTQTNSNTQANTSALSMYSSLPSDESNSEVISKEDNTQNGEKAKEEQTQSETATNNKSQNNEQNQSEDKEANGNEKMELEENQEVDEKSDKLNEHLQNQQSNPNILELELQQPNEQIQTEEQNKSPKEEQKEESKSEQDTKSTQNSSNQSEIPTFPPIVKIEEKLFRPKYGENILKKYNNEEFWKSNSILEYKLFVIKQYDNYLLFAGPILANLKNKYYEEQSEQDRDIRDVYKKYQRSILSEVKIALSSIIRRDKNETVENNIVCRRFVKMGGTIVEKFQNSNDINYLIVGHSPRKDKVKKAIDNNIPIISYKWIEYCWYFNYKFDIQIFEVNKTDFSYKKNDQQLQQELFEKYGTLAQI